MKRTDWLGKGPLPWGLKSTPRLSNHCGMGDHYHRPCIKALRRAQLKLCPCCLRCPRLPARGERDSLPCAFTRMVEAVAEADAAAAGVADKPRPAILTRVLCWDDRAICLIDRTPGARHHLLVIPRERIRDVLSLRSTQLDIDLLHHMHRMGERALSEVVKADEQGILLTRFTFHVPPCTSVPHLHLHCLAGPLTMIGKVKFTHSHAIDVGDAIAMLESELPAGQGRAQESVAHGRV